MQPSNRSEFTTATRGPLSADEAARPRASSSLRAVWRKVVEIDRRINDCWIGDILAGLGLAVISIGLTVIVGVLQ